jgi:hypothetical protein
MQDDDATAADREHVQAELVNPDGAGHEHAGDEAQEQITSPTKLIRIASMVRGMLDEVRRAPLDDAGRRRLREIHEKSLEELEGVLSPDLRQELADVAALHQRRAERVRLRPQPSSWLLEALPGIEPLFTQQAMAQGQLEEITPPARSIRCGRPHRQVPVSSSQGSEARDAVGQTVERGRRSRGVTVRAAAEWKTRRARRGARRTAGLRRSCSRAGAQPHCCLAEVHDRRGLCSRPVTARDVRGLLQNAIRDKMKVILRWPSC